MKRILSILLISVLTLTASVVFVDNSYATEKPTDWYFTGSECTNNAVAASTIDYIQAKYPTGSVYKGAGECYGWAEKISNMLSAKRSTKHYTALRFNKKNLLAKCKGVKAGTHLRVSNEKTFNGYSGHSICLLKVTNDMVYWTDANVGGIYNGIRHKSSTIERFLGQYSFDYINTVTKNLEYKAQSSEPLLTIKRTENGKGTLYWAKASSTSKYKVYRATSENGKYKLVKTTTTGSYADASAPLGKKYYYMVKAIKKNGKTIASNKTSFTARLSIPTIESYDTDNRQGQIQIFWTKVKGANKYKIYRCKHNYDTEKETYKYVGTSKTTSFKDKTAINPHVNYCYKVKAVYAKNQNANSLLSDEYHSCSCRLAAPTLSYTYDETNNKLQFSWSKVPYATEYTLDSNCVWLSPVSFKNKTSCTIDVDDLPPGGTYSFCINVKAYHKKYCYRIYAKSSNKVTFQVPGEKDHDKYGDYEAYLDMWNYWE